MASKAQKRLGGELKKLNDKPPEGVDMANTGPVGDDILKWRAVVVGPAGSAYEGAALGVTLDFPAEYPFQPPEVKFTGQTFHPNVDDKGEPCLPMLNRENWKPMNDIAGILTTLLGIMVDPSPDHARNTDAAQMYIENNAQWRTKVKEALAKNK